MRAVLAAAVAWACLVSAAGPLAASASARPDEGPVMAAAVRPETAIFFYPWFGTPARDGAYAHWQQGGSVPPGQVASSYYPARGPYSSSDERVLAAQMRELALAGVSTVVVSWWGQGSVEDQRLPRVIAAARRAGLGVAAHLEPYPGRTVQRTGDDIAYLRLLGLRDFYVWASSELPAADWRELNAKLSGVRVFANTNLAGLAAAGGFDGLYTYDVLIFNGSLFPRLCAQARRLQLLCAPSVGPGYDARRATGDTRLKPRRNGATYDAMWRGAIKSGADVVTVTSYNEWHEGTQIEAARADRRGYESYDGAWGLRGRAAETSYLERTRYWTSRFAATRP